MAEDYYPGSEDESNLPPDDAETKKPEGETALLPKSLVGEVEPGATLTLKVIHVYEDEVEVEKSGEEKEPETKAPPTADEEIDAMAMAKE